MVKYQFEDGVESRLLVHLESLVNQNSEAMVKTIYILIEYYCKSFKFWNESLLEIKKAYSLRKRWDWISISDIFFWIYGSVPFLMEKNSCLNFDLKTFFSV